MDSNPKLISIEQGQIEHKIKEMLFFKEKELYKFESWT